MLNKSTTASGPFGIGLNTPYIYIVNAFTPKVKV